MANIFTDKAVFTDSNGVSVATKYSGTNLNAGGLEIYGNGFQAAADGANDGVVFTNSSSLDTERGTFGADQYAQIVIAYAPVSYDVGVIVRGTGGASDLGYLLVTASDSILQIFLIVSGGFYALATFALGVGLSGGETLMLTAKGTTLEAYVDGASVGSTTNATLATGGVGLYCSKKASAVVGDNFEAGNLTAFIPPPISWDYQSGRRARAKAKRTERLIRITSGEGG